MGWLTESVYKAILLGIGWGILITIYKIVFKKNEKKKTIEITSATTQVNSTLSNAIVNNDKNAQFKIGQEYWLGDNRIKDESIGYAWLRIAKQNKSDAAEFYLKNTVYPAIHQKTVDNSTEIFEQIKFAIKQKDAHLCNLQIEKSLSDRGIYH